MKITSGKLILFISSLVTMFVIGFIVMFLYASKNNISDDAKFSDSIGKPLKIKSISQLRWSKDNLRFKNYSLVENDSSIVDLEDVKTVKVYPIGAIIKFYAAKSYKSMHVGETYYLLGKDTLDSGKVVEFEYYTGSNYSPEIWESEAEFLERVQNSSH